MKSSEVTTEQELDRRIAEVQARRVTRNARAERYGYYADLVCFGLIVCLGAAHLLIPVFVPQAVSDRITGITDGLWMLLPGYLVGVLISRIDTYRTKRREALSDILRP
jgi:hypothetical protein